MSVFRSGLLNRRVLKRHREFNSLRLRNRRFRGLKTTINVVRNIGVRSRENSALLASGEVGSVAKLARHRAATSTSSVQIGSEPLGGSNGK